MAQKMGPVPRVLLLEWVEQQAESEKCGGQHSPPLALGWAYDSAMLKCPITTFGYGTLNHTKHHTKLRPMSELKALCGLAEKKAA